MVNRWEGLVCEANSEGKEDSPHVNRVWQFQVLVKANTGGRCRLKVLLNVVVSWLAYRMMLTSNVSNATFTKVKSRRAW